MPRPKRPSNAAERAATFAAAQATLTPEQLQTQRAQNEASSKILFALSTIADIKSARRWFLEFMEDQHPDVDAEAVYLRPGSPFPPMPLLKEYLRYLSRSRVGNLRDKLSVVTLKNYATNLCMLIKKETGLKEVEKTTRQELRHFVYSDLVEQEGIHTAAYDKHVVNSEDLTYLTSRLYEREFVVTFPNMRKFINFNLYICLMVDCCERGGAILRGDESTEEMCLRWQDISFYTYQSEDDPEPTFDIAANVTIRWSKGQKLKESEWRTIPLPKLLPLSMAPEDTLRLLLTLAILDGVLYGVGTWEDLGKIRAPSNEARTGRRMRMVDEMKESPVLRYADRNHNLTDSPETLVRMTQQLKRLGVYAGLENRLIGYCLRRGVANKLEAEVSAENRRFMMGHRTTSTVYSAYHSRVSTVDTVRILRGMPESEEVSRHSSMLLNRVDSAPREISADGMERVYADAGLRELETKIYALREEILAKHPSIISASRTQDPLWDEYHKTEIARRCMIRRLVREEFEREYAATFQGVGPQAVASPEDVETDREQDLDQILGSEDMADPDGVGEMDLAVELSVIDPQLWQQAEDLERIRDEEMAEAEASEDESRDDDPPEDTTEPMNNQVPPADGEQDAEDPSMRLHQLVDDHIGRTRVGDEDGKQGYRRLPRPSAKLLRASAYNDLGGELQRAQESEEGVCRLLLRYFAVMHSTHDFHSGLEPKLGTYNCRFCGESLAKEAHAWRHVFKCAKADATQRMKDHFDNSMRDNTCGWKTMNPSQGDIRECEFGGVQTTPYTQRQWYRHVKNCHLKGEESVTCYFGDCASLSQDDEPTLQGTLFDSGFALRAHISSTHSMWTSYSISAEFCLYCQTWINSAVLNTHMAGHSADMQSNVARFGYTGFAIRDMALIPAVCPFHFHDETIPAEERATVLNVSSLSRHIFNAHILKLQKEESLMVCPSYPSMCTKADAMDAEQMKQHLIIVHGIKQLAHAKDRTQETASTKQKRKQAEDNRQPLEETSGNSRKKPNQTSI